VEACDRALAANDTDEEMHKLRGDALLLSGDVDAYRRTTPEGAGRVERAVRSYDRAIALRANYPDALAMRAYAYSVLGRQDLSRQDLEAALRVDPRSFVALITHSKPFSDLHTPESLAKAEELLRAALKVKADSFSARVNLAVIVAEQGVNPQSERWLDEAIELNPDHAWGYYLKGALLARDRRFDEAEPLLTQAIKLEASMPSFYYNRGVIRANLGRDDDARADYEKALQLGHPEPDKVRQRIAELKH